MNTIKKLSATLLTLAFITAGYAQSFDKAKLDQFFDRLSEKNKSMGSFAMVKDGKILYTRSIGHSQINGTEKKPITSETRFRVGSITKMFTATMIFQLVEEGKLRLTDTLSKFFPQIPNASKITISQLLAHRSGIHDLTNDPNFRSWKNTPKTQSEMLAIVAKGVPEFEPDTKHEYSNSGFLLLGYIIENLTGKTYQEALQKRITSRIGLKDTYLGTGYTDTGKKESFSFIYGIDWKQEIETHLSIPGGAGAIISIPTDLTQFIHSLFSLKLVSQASLEQMMKNKMGIKDYPHDSIIIYGHGGGINGFRSFLAYLPEEKLAVAYTSNGVVYPVIDIVSAAFDIYLNKPFTIPAFEIFAVSTEILDKYVGVYSRSEASVKFTVTRQGTILFVEMTGKSAISLEATALDKFKIESAGMVIEFNAEQEQMIIKRNGGERVFTKEN